MTDHEHNWYGTVCLVCGIENIDAALATVPPATETATSTATVRKCYRHQWVGMWRAVEEGLNETWNECERCGRVQDPIASRRGKSNARLGKDQERRAERRYGLRKVGEFGGIVDLQGETTVVQQKSTRAAAPIKWKSIFAKLDGAAHGRMPAILLSFVRPGVPTEDFFIVRGSDWLAWRGRDEES